MNGGIKIEEIKEKEFGSKIEGIFILSNADIKETKSGDFFLIGTLKDASGKISFISWDIKDVEYCRYNITNYQVFRVKGILDSYQDKLRIKAEEIIPVKKDSLSLEILEKLVPSITSEEREYYFEKIKSLFKKLKNKKARILIKKLFSNDKFVKIFRKAPAAIKVHHAYLGGLLRHTANVMELAYEFYNRYKRYMKNIDLDIILLSSFFHDIGKINEYTFEINFSSTDEGKLIGHTIISYEFFSQLVSQIEDFPNHIELGVKHCILSHHGEIEWGAVVLPKTVEALIVSLADYVDSKVIQAIESIDKIEMGTWSAYNNFLKRSIFSSQYELLENKNPLKEVLKKDEKIENKINLSPISNNLFNT